jgi:hypothetical protein
MEAPGSGRTPSRDPPGISKSLVLHLTLVAHQTRRMSITWILDCHHLSFKSEKCE